MKKTFLFLVIISILFSLLSCKDPIFYTISKEQPPLVPRIQGSSSNFVIFNDIMYVGSGSKLYLYFGYEQWASFNMGKRIINLAATNSKFYILYQDGSLGVPGEIPVIIPEYKVHGIFAIDDVLFISAESRGIFSVFYITDSDSTLKSVTLPINPLSPEKIMPIYKLCGVASDADNYYLTSIHKFGIFVLPKISLDSTAVILEDSFEAFTNIINLTETFIVAMTRDGDLYQIKPDGVIDLQKWITDARSSSGALAVWESGTENRKLLLAGSQDIYNSITTGLTHGYVEVEFDDDSIIGNFVEPGRYVFSTVNDHELYYSSIGKHGIRYMIQAPDGILFASTNHGVWSYRFREGLVSWNAEE